MSNLTKIIGTLTTSEWTQVITAATALVAVVVGPAVSIYVARRQIRAAVVSANRQVWINSLRDAISDYLAKHAIAWNLNRLLYADKSSVPRIEEIVRLNTRIALLVNPGEPDHARLAKMFDEMTNVINRTKTGIFDIDWYREQILALSQSIIKREWNRVKRGD
ncbi:MAG: hypothetical protein IT442_07130 [Phycisphaeraceae bacterium]|nr:hypothetical protein [Phycisphaeraceae bacterium]